jgi:hypothetical protein
VLPPLKAAIAASTSSSDRPASRAATFGFRLKKREVRFALDDLEVVPELAHGGFRGIPSVGQREHAHHLREVRVGRGADQQTARLVAVLVGIPSEPGPRAAARAERVHLELRRFVETA